MCNYQFKMPLHKMYRRGINFGKCSKFFLNFITSTLTYLVYVYVYNMYYTLCILYPIGTNIIVTSTNVCLKNIYAIDI